MGRMTSHILWTIKTVPNHQPVNQPAGCFLPGSTSSYTTLEPRPSLHQVTVSLALRVVAVRVSAVPWGEKLRGASWWLTLVNNSQGLMFNNGQ